MAEGGEWPMEKLINTIITLLVQSLLHLIKRCWIDCLMVVKRKEGTSTSHFS